MTIGEVIKKYREEHDLSQRQFALRCNVSNGYISMLEKGINPKTNEPIMPSIAALKAISSAMKISLNELLVQADDMPVNLSSVLMGWERESEEKAPAQTDERVSEFTELFSKLSDDNQDLVLSLLESLAKKQ